MSTEEITPKRKAATHRAHRLFTQQYTLRKERKFPDNPLPWQDGPLTDADGDLRHPGITVSNEGKCLTFDFSKGVYADDVLAVMRDLMRTQYAWDVEHRSDKGIANRSMFAALGYLQDAIYMMDNRAKDMHGYSGNPAEAVIKYDYQEHEEVKASMRTPGV